LADLDSLKEKSRIFSYNNEVNDRNRFAVISMDFEELANHWTSA